MKKQTPSMVTLHCSATPDDKNSQWYDTKAYHIADWHINKEKWKAIGYHHVIERDGTIIPGRLETEEGSHVRGFNANNIGVCMVGTSEFTDAQWNALYTLYFGIKLRWGLESRDWLGHCEHKNVVKTCPNIDLNKLRDRLAAL